MGIRLDWQVEAEQSHIHTEREDPTLKWARRRARYRLLGFVVVVLFFIALGISFIAYRLDTVNKAIERNLRQTVEAEMAALRFGDLNTFLALQHHDNPAWVAEQQDTFDTYQTLKVEHDVQLTGNVLQVYIEGNRARVHVEEIIDGVPYTRLWFYWRFEDGWLHVPTDYTFWGDLRTYEGTYITVRYRGVDDPLAVAVGLKSEKWMQNACNTLACPEEMPHITIDILPTGVSDIQWAEGNMWQMLIPSPYAERARSDRPFDTEMQVAVATLLAERITSIISNELSPVYPTDSYYLRAAVVSWLVGQFVEINTNSFLIASLAQNYGEDKVGLLLRSLTPTSEVSIFSNILDNRPLNELTLDWRDLLTWRLATEDELIRRDDLNAYLSLYDTNDDAAINAAYTHYAEGPSPEPRVIVAVTPEVGEDGQAYLRAIAVQGQGQSEIRFRLVNNVWKRVE